MKFKVKATIELQPEIDPEIIQQILEPENTTPDTTEIVSSVRDDKVITEITGEMQVRTLLRSIDDIIQTTILGENVASATEIRDQTE